MKVREARFVLSAVRHQDLVSDGRPQIAFVGRSNVGKSSLLNRLVGRKALAKISSSPGKTRAVNYFEIDASFYLVDLPGFGFARAAKSERRAWADLMDRYFRTTEPQPWVVQLIDAKVGATALDVQAAEYLRSTGSESAVVVTKIDRLPRSQRRSQLQGIRRTLQLSDETTLTACSSKTGEGIREIWKGIHAFLRVSAETAN